MQKSIKKGSVVSNAIFPSFFMCEFVGLGELKLAKIFSEKKYIFLKGV